MTNTIAVLPGDGIGPEIMHQALRVLAAIDHDNQFETIPALVGGAAFEEYGEHFPANTIEACTKADAILFGSVGGPVSDAHLPKWKSCEANTILALRKQFNLSTNLRPATLYPALTDISPLRKELVADGIDMLIVRELVGDIYFGEHKQFEADGQRCAEDTATYTEAQIKVAAYKAFEAAQLRKGKVTSVDKANVLATSKLWREVVTEVSRDFPNVKLEHMLVDNCAMQLILNPAQFDVIVTANLFGDILSDAASAIPGSLGLMPSASFSPEGMGLYEPSGGSAPDIAGKDIANPIGQILSLAMMLRFSFNRGNDADLIEHAVKRTLTTGFRTADIMTPGCHKVGTLALTDAIVDRIQEEQ